MGLGIFIYHYVYLKIYKHFPWEWEDNGAIYFMNYNVSPEEISERSKILSKTGIDNRGLPANWQIRTDMKTGRESYVVTGI